MEDKVKAMLMAVFSVALGSFGSAVSAQDQSELNYDYEKTIAEATTRISGSETPDKVPLRSKYRALIRHYDRVHSHALEGHLSAEDQAVIRRAADSEQQATFDRRTRQDQTVNALCLERDRYEPIELAQELESFNQNADENDLARYREIMSWLSAEGKQTIEDYIDSTVTPGMTLTAFDEIHFARQHPQAFALTFEDQCHYYRTGTHLPEIQEVIDRHTTDQPTLDSGFVFDIVPLDASSSGATAELDP